MWVPADCVKPPPPPPPPEELHRGNTIDYAQMKETEYVIIIMTRRIKRNLNSTGLQRG